MLINMYNCLNSRLLIALVLIVGVSGDENNYDSLNCNFDNDTCGWKDLNHVWTIGSSTSSQHNLTWTPIQGDHNHGPGGYAYLDPIRLWSSKSRTGSLISPELKGSEACLTFWYYMFGLEPGEMTVIQSIGEDSDTIVWKRQSNFGRQWMKSSVSLVAGNNFEPWTVSFIVSYADVNHEILTIDDTKLSSGPCSSFEMCDFETSNCLLTNESFGASFWSVGPVYKLNHPLIVTDHSTQTETGHIAYIRGIGAKDVAILQTETFNHTGHRCLKFWYTSTSDSFQMEINQVDQEHNTNYQLWTRNRNHFGDWRQGIVQLKEMASSSYNIDFRVAFTKPDGGYYALDDLSIETGSCPDSVDCDFSYNTCQWATSNSMETFDWIRMNGQLLGSGLVGPGNGQDDKDDDDFYLYAYFDPSLSIKSAIIDSGDFDITQQDHYCLKFNLWTVNRVKLELIVEMLQNENELKPVFTLKDEDFPESSWQQVSTLIYVNHSDSMNDFQFLRLRAVYVSEDEELGPDGKPKPHPFAAIAIDDITFTEGLCQGQEPTQNPPTTTLPPPITDEINCDFETNTCGLFNDPLKSTSSWYRRTSVRTKTDVTNVPATDHTYNQPNGHFLFSRFQSKGEKKISELSTKKIKAIDSTKGDCLSFWYYIRGTKSTSLSISMVRSSDSVDKIIWKRTNIYADYWYQGYVNIEPVDYDFTLEIIADHSTDTDSGMALDDIIYSSGHCPASTASENCDFELGSCGYDNGDVFNEVWKLVNGFDNKSITTDHTTQTESGSFLIAQYDSTITEDGDAKNGYLFYDSFVHPQYNCIEFSANVHRGQLSFNIIFMIFMAELGTNDVTLWSANETQGWTTVRLPLPFPGQTKMLAFRFIGQGYAALDDISLLTECQPVGYCNFERDTCGWTSGSDDYKTFRRDHGRLYDEYSPSHDMTTKKDSGSYVVANFEKMKKPTSEKYSLISPLISPMTNYCLSFWYYKNGKDLPTLHVILNQFDSKMIYLKTIDSKTKLDFWDRLSIQIDKLTGNPFTIELRASVKPRTLRPALVAIDDIELYPGQCADSIEVIDETEYSCDSHATKVTGNLLCDFHADCKDAWDESNCGYNCDFETGPCGWKGGVNPSDQLRIIDLDKSAITPQYEINYHETGKGKYWKLNTKTSKTLTYLSPVMRNSGEHCYIDFYLYMTIADNDEPNSDLSEISHLTISIVDLRSTQVTPIHQISDNLGKNWHLIRLYIGRIPSDFRLRFEVLSKKANDRIVIDKITADSACFAPRTGDANSCPSDKFFCSRSKSCIDLSMTCDYCDDCGDGEDEEDDLAQCSLRSGRCDFNQGNLCDWSTQISSNSNRKEKWRLVDYDDDTYDVRSTSPTRDHTFNTAEGKFMISTGTTGLPKYSLTSPLLYRPDPQSICSFNFYYQFTDSQSVIKAVNSSAIGQSNHNYLEVSIDLPHLSSTYSLETILGSYLLESPHFKRATINIGPEVVTHNRLFQLSLSAVRSSDSSASWAVDDVSFSSDCKLADCYLRCSRDQSCITLDHRCDFISDCDPTDEPSNLGEDEVNCTSVNCPFGQDDTCHWEVIKSNDSETLTWKLYQPLSDPVDQPQFIPKSDATNHDASGWLLIFDSRDSLIAGSAQLWSQMIGRTSAQCSLSFNYFCQPDQCDLTIYLETDIDRPETNLKRIWEPHQVNQDLTIKWRPGIAQIGAIKYGRILISGSSEFNNDSFAISLDDLTFVNCAPPQPSPPETPCDSTKSFQCSNDNCIDKSFECDFVDDCLDGSDELSCDNLPARCDFETPCVSWKPDPYRYDKFATISWGQTADLPSYDHTLGVASGTYLSLSGSQKSVDVWARHYSPVINGSSDDCSLNLWVNIIDTSLSSELVIYQRFNYSTSGYQVIARVSSSHVGEYWKKYNIKLPKTVDEYEIVLEGFISKDIDASINIDDLTLTRGCYLAENGTTLPGVDEPTTLPPTTPGSLFDCYYGYKPCSSVVKCYPFKAECDFKDDCGDGTDEANCPSRCTFENDFCGWKNSKSDKFGSWIIKSASKTTKPNIDHTEGDESGYYAIAKFETEETDISVSLTSPLFSYSGPRCTFTFYYYMTLKTISDADKHPRLQVYLNQGNTSKLIQSLWGKHTDAWYMSYVNIGQHDGPFSVTIEAIKLGESSDVVKAIDDISFDECPSSKKSIMEDCPVNQWECQSATKCLPVYHLCDGFNDCNDGQDEVHCSVVPGNCDFTSSWRGQCLWTEVETIEGGCSIINPSSKDNFIEFIADKSFVCDSTLVSPKFPPTTHDSCHFSFQYKTKTNSGDTWIKIGLISEGKHLELNRFKGNRVSNDWTIYHLAINHSKSYQVYLITSITESDSSIYLKSIRFSPNCPTGGPLTLELYPGKTEPWEPSSEKPFVPTTVPTAVPTTHKVTTAEPLTIAPPVTRPVPTERPKSTTKAPEPVTKRPEDHCNCNDNLIPEECREFCHNKKIAPLPQGHSKKHSSASIFYISLGIIGSIAIIVITINFLMPTINRIRYRRTLRGILDDRFNDDGQFDSIDGRNSINDPNLFGLSETRTRFGNLNDSL